MYQRRPYMVFAESPPEGYTADDELLVSLTIGDVAEAYNEYAHTVDENAEAEFDDYAWEKLSPEKRGFILKAVSESGVDLETIFSWA